MVGVSRLVIMVGVKVGRGVKVWGGSRLGGQGFLGQGRGQGCGQGQGLCVKVRVMIGGHKVGVKVGVKGGVRVKGSRSRGSGSDGQWTMLEINRDCSFQELVIEFQSIPFHSMFYSMPK